MQPLPNTIRLARRDVEVIGLDAILDARRELTRDIGRVAAHFSSLELSLNYLLTYLLMGKQPAAFAIFHDIVDLNIRKEAFDRAANGVLSENLRQEIRALFEKTRRIADSRNDIVHGIWAVSHLRENSLLRCTIKSLNIRINEGFGEWFHDALAGKEPKPGTIRAVSEALNETKDEYEEYKLADFEFTVNRIKELQEQADRFGVKVAIEMMRSLAKDPPRQPETPEKGHPI